MKHIPNIIGCLLGLAFIAISLMYFFKMIPPQPALPEGSAAAHFGAAFGPTGYMDFVKSCELIGGILTLIPLTRNIGLLFLGPVLVNILAHNIFIMKGQGLFAPPIVPILCLLALYLLWADRARFSHLLNR